MTGRQRWVDGWAGAIVGLGMLVLAGCSPASDGGGNGSGSGDARRIIDEAATALGGRDRLLTVKSLIAEGGGTASNLGQDLTPEATSQTFAITEYRRVHSFTANALRIEQTRTPNFPYFQGQAAQKQIMGVDGDIGYNISPLGIAVRVSEVATKQRRVDLFHHPVAIVRAALEPGTQLSNVRSEGTDTLVDLLTQTGVTLTLGVDSKTHLPTRVRSAADDANLGDVVLETAFSDYRDNGGVKVPTHVITKTDRWTTSDLTMTQVEVDGITGDMAAPEDAVGSRPAASAPEPVIDEQELAPGVWLIAGQSHHSVLVEFSDQLLLIEAPQSEARTLAVIRKARELRPGKPLTRVVNTHHHFDHSAGIRAAVSEGLAVVTHAGNSAFFADIVKRPHTANPDALQRAPKPLNVEAVTDTRDFTDPADPARKVQLFHVAGSPHSSTMLMAWLPKEKLLVEADAFTPNAPAPYAANLLENIQKRSLAVERIVPLHGVVVPFDELRKAVATAASPAPAATR